MTDQSVKIYKQRSDEQNKQKSKSKESTGSNKGYKRQRDNSGDPINSGGHNKENRIKLKDISANENNQYTDAALSASRIPGAAGGSSETGISSQLGSATTNNVGTAVTRHLSNKSDTNLNGHSAASTSGAPSASANRNAQRQASEGRKKRKNSDKVSF